MASPVAFSTNLGIGVLPEFDPKTNPEVYTECTRLRSAIRNVASSLDSYVGISGASRVTFNNGWISFGSGSGITASGGLTFDAVTFTLVTSNFTAAALKSSGNTLGFFTAASSPIAQPTTAISGASFTANAGTAVNDASTFDGYTIKQVVKALRDLGLLT